MKNVLKLMMIICIGLLMCEQIVAQEKKAMLPNGWQVHDMKRPQPAKVSAGKTNTNAPSDAIILFDGSNLDAWTGDNQKKWKLEKDYMEVAKGTGSMMTTQAFGDIQLHVEWATPALVEDDAQRRGNSGVLLMNQYEIQIMDGWENFAYADGMAGAVYGQNPALVNVCKKPGEWQTYDLVFKAPVFKDGKLVSPAFVTIFQNGVLVQNHTEIYGPTKHNKVASYEAHKEKLPLILQNHNAPVRFRNIWLREL